MPTFPTTVPFKYQVKRTARARSAAYKFYDLSEQRNAKGTVLAEIMFSWAKITTAQKETLRAFYDAQQADVLPFALTFDTVSYPVCRFVGLFQADNVYVNQWNVKLDVKVSQS